MRDDSDPRPTRPAQTYTAFDEPSDRLGVEHAADAFPGSPGMLFKQAMAQTRMSICLTDPHLPDNPIVFANRAFRELTGYRDDELIGRNCRFLQGPKTDPAPVAAMREALANFDERLQTLEEKVTTGFAGLTRSLALIQLDAGGGGMGGGPGLPAPADAGGPPKNVYEGEWERAACVCACVR